MMLLIQDESPFTAAQMVPDRLKFKQLIELGQLVCSAGISDLYKPVHQGKELQEWIKDNPEWTYYYMDELFNTCKSKFKDPKKKQKCEFILIDLKSKGCLEFFTSPKYLVFRFKEGYDTEYDTNTRLTLKEGVEQYKKYVEWKENKFYEEKLRKIPRN